MVYRSVFNSILAHAKIVEVFKKYAYKAKIGTVLNHAYIYSRRQNRADLEAAHHLALTIQICYEEPLLLGTINQEWLALVETNGVHIEIKEGDREGIAQDTIHVLGLNI